MRIKLIRNAILESVTIGKFLEMDDSDKLIAMAKLKALVESTELGYILVPEILGVQKQAISVKYMVNFKEHEFEILDKDLKNNLKAYKVRG